MPKDHWAAARAKDRGKRSRSERFTKARGKQRRKLEATRRAWFTAIDEAKGEIELTMIARSVATMRTAGKMSERQYNAIVRAGKNKRRALRWQRQQCEQRQPTG